VSILAGYATNPELELQQRAVEFASLFNLGEIRAGVLERMPAPELKATVTGVGKCLTRMLVRAWAHIKCTTVSENKPVGSTKGKDVSTSS